MLRRDARPPVHSR